MRIEIDTRAVGKARPRFTRSGRCYTPKKTTDYEKLISREWSKCGVHYGDAPVTVTIVAIFEPPRSLSNKKRQELIGTTYVKKPDVDNIIKSVLDGLNGVAYDDDKQVAVVTCQKIYGAHDKVIVDIEEVV